MAAVSKTAGALLGTPRVHRWAHRLAPGWREFADEALAVSERHWKQTHQTVAALKRKYEEAVFGRQGIWELVEKLALCVDPTDGELYGASQLIHTRQVVAGMERDGVSDPDFFLAAITHDLGKVLWLLRYHSILIESSRPFMDARDHAYLERYLVPFRKYDQDTKSCCLLPPQNILDKYRDLVERTFPRSLLI